MSPEANQPPPAPSLKRRMLAGGFWVLLGKSVTVLCTLANEALLTRMLGEHGYGVYVTAFSFVSVAAVSVQMGLHQAVVKFIAASMGLSQPGRAREAVRLVYRWALVGAAVGFLVIVAGPGALLVKRGWDAPELAASIGSLAVWAVLISFQVITSESFRGFKDLRFAALFGGAITGILNVCLLTMIWLGWGHTGIGVALRVIVVASAISLGLGLLVLYRRYVVKLPVERGSIQSAELFSTAGPLWAMIFVNNLLAHADRLIMAAYLTKPEIGIYGAAARLVMLVSQPLILINLLVPPFIAELYARGEKKRLERILRQTAALAGIPALVVLLGFVFFGESILGLFYPDAYRAGAGILAILSISKMANVFFGSAGITMAMTGHQHILMRIAVFFSGLSIVGVFLVVPRWGAVGVAVVVTTGSSLVFAAQWLATKRYTGMWTHASIPSLDQIKSLFR